MFAPPQPMMREYCERDAEGTGPVLDQDEGEEVLLRCPEVTLAFSPEESKGLGNLTVTNMRVVWLSSEDDSRACDFDVPYICLHAISKDAGTFPTPCIYCQLAEEEEDVLKEAFFSPRDAETLQALFNAFSKAAELNPGDGDDDDDDDDNGGEGDEEEREGGGGEGFSSIRTEEQARILAHLDSVLVVPEGMEAQDGQFEDAEEDLEEEANGHVGEGAANGHVEGAGTNSHVEGRGANGHVEERGTNGTLPQAPSS